MKVIVKMGPQNFEVFIDKYKQLKSQKCAFVVVTLVNGQGSVPQEMGARCLVTKDGLSFGTVGGGKIEAAAIKRAQQLLTEKRATTHFQDWNLQKDLGMSCGGTVSLFFEIHHPELSWNIVVFGAGHVAQELVPILTKLECSVQCIDSRSEWLDRLPLTSNLETFCTTQPELMIEKINPQSYVVVMTMGHATDLPILIKAMSKKFPYVGVMGSPVKAKAIKKDLLAAGLTQAEIEPLFCPIGEQIGNNTPIEIALSVVAQLLKVRDKK